MRKSSGAEAGSAVWGTCRALLASGDLAWFEGCDRVSGSRWRSPGMSSVTSHSLTFPMCGVMCGRILVSCPAVAVPSASVAAPLVEPRAGLPARTGRSFPLRGLCHSRGVRSILQGRVPGQAVQSSAVRRRCPGAGLSPRRRRQADGARPVWFYGLTDRSWACVMFRDGGTARVWQSGPRRLWDEAEAAYRWWEREGRPGHERFGLTVTAGRQTVWLDEPERSWPV